MADTDSATEARAGVRIGTAAGGAESFAERRARRLARPTFRNIGVGDIVRYRMPPAAFVSILHRVSGILMFLVGIPFLLYLFQNSLTSEISFQVYRSMVSSWIAKLLLLALIWAFLHHLIAGIRFLFLDLHLAIEREQETLSARIVLGLSVLLTLVCAALLIRHAMTRSRRPPSVPAGRLARTISAERRVPGRPILSTPHPEPSE